MKLFREAIIIFGIYLLGVLIADVTRLPIPGNVIGMVILFLLLCFKVIKVEQISTISNFFLDHLAFFFIPAGVSLIQSLGLIKENAILLLSCIILINIAVMIGCGKSVDFMIKLKEKKETKSKQEIA